MKKKKRQGKRERERGRRKGKRREGTSSLVAESPRYEGAIERRNVVVVPGSVCTDGGGSKVGCGGMTGGVEELGAGGGGRGR